MFKDGDVVVYVGGNTVLDSDGFKKSTAYMVRDNGYGDLVIPSPNGKGTSFILQKISSGITTWGRFFSVIHTSASAPIASPLPTPHVSVQKMLFNPGDAFEYLGGSRDLDKQGFNQGDIYISRAGKTHADWVVIDSPKKTGFNPQMCKGMKSCPYTQYFKHVPTQSAVNIKPMLGMPIVPHGQPPTTAPKPKHKWFVGQEVIYTGPKLSPDENVKYKISRIVDDTIWIEVPPHKAGGFPGHTDYGLQKFEENFKASGCAHEWKLIKMFRFDEWYCPHCKTSRPYNINEDVA